MAPEIIFLALLSILAGAADSATWNFTRCVKSCQCYSENNVNILDCFNSSLELFPEPESIPSDVHLINLSHNSIRFIPDSYMFWHPECVVLDISYNKLGNLPNFEGLYRLKQLNLANNSLPYLPKNGFAPLIYLEELHLEANQIAFISQCAFQNLYSLRKLDLSWNKLQNLPYLIDLQNLQEFYADGNLIENPEWKFLDLPSLRSLSMAWNNLYQLEPLALQNVLKLESLNLAHNHFSILPRNFLQPVAATLKKIDLSFLPIDSISSGDFLNLHALQEIDLSSKFFR
ncbi:unnamed protein product [Gongylonema pulchrum]|uniref:LRRNT domain-containing protein n=1 Tax=Gongylonema pulchrum TaxID=637853 RepID=A0A183DE37_9BILA|nr:unnamed protein product [Gongylonema pulchrum]